MMSDDLVCVGVPSAACAACHHDAHDPSRVRHVCRRLGTRLDEIIGGQAAALFQAQPSSDVPPVPVDALASTLQARGAVYGDFINNAALSQDLKGRMRSEPRWQTLPADQQEALDFFCSKMSRILTGSASHIDNWHDIAGYARLVEQRLTAGGGA
jgi:hypothetical protein